MSHYVKIPAVNGRLEYYQLAKWALESGVGSVDLHTGGWHDNESYLYHPHIKFETKEDALAYILSHGGEYSEEPPRTRR